MIAFTIGIEKVPTSLYPTIMQASLQLFTASSGKLSAKVVFDNNSVRHLHSTVNPEAEADLYQDIHWYGNLIVFAGIGLGWHVKRMLSKLPAHVSCIVIDYFKICTNHAAETLFAGSTNRVLYISAEDVAQDTLSGFLASVDPGSLQVVRHPASIDCFRDFYESLVDEIARRFVPRPPRQGSAVKKALMYFGNYFLEEETRRALRATGIAAVPFEYNTCRDSLDYEASLSKMIQKEKPDFILSINMKGFDGNGETGRIAERFGVPLVIWFVDDPRPILLSNRIHIRPHMTALSWERDHCRLLTAAGFDKAEYVPLACDPALFTDTGPTSRAAALGFVGTSMVDRFAGNIRDKFLWSDGLVPLVEALAGKLCADPAYPVYESIPNQAKALGIRLAFSDERNLTWLAAYIVHHASMKKRKAAIQALLPQGIETFGDPEGWKKLFGGAVITHPDVDYRHGLASVYKRIAININVTSCQMPTAVNQRVFDIPMTGSFVISDKQNDLLELFGPSEIATYESLEDLQEKVRFYLANEAERGRITKLAQKRILGEHTYVHRMQKIMSLL